MTDQMEAVQAKLLKGKRRLKWMSWSIMIAFTLIICAALGLHISYLNAIEAAETEIRLWLIDNEVPEFSKPVMLLRKGRAPVWRVDYSTHTEKSYIHVTIGGGAVWPGPSVVSGLLPEIPAAPPKHTSTSNWHTIPDIPWMEGHDP